MAKIEIVSESGKFDDTKLLVEGKEVKNLESLSFFMDKWCYNVSMNYSQKKEQTGDFQTYVNKTFCPATASFTEEESALPPPRSKARAAAFRGI
jgi:hypothetical protein